MSPPRKDGRRCTATNRKGARCGNAPIMGGTVCRIHGGGAPQVQAVAATKVLEALVGPALVELRGLLRNPKTPAPVRMAAVKDILDRNGYRPVQTVGFLTEAQIQNEIDRRKAEQPDP